MTTKRVYITKFALTQGILVADAEPDPKSKEHVLVRGAYPWDWKRFGLGDWYEDRERAIKRAQQVAEKKASDLELQAEHLRAKAASFTAPDLV